MTTIRNSTDSQVLGWGALTVAVLVVAAFLTMARPPAASASLPHGNQGVNSAHVMKKLPGRV
jgi:hypothetical protein